MKRIFCLLLAACLVISLGGCAVPQAPQASQDAQTTQDTATIQWSSDEYKNAEIMAQKIVKCLIEKDRDGFNALFCKPTRSTSCFTDYVGNLFNMFYYDSYIGYRYDDMVASYAKENDKEILRTLQAEIIYIEVPAFGADGEENSKFYGLEWYWVLACEENPDLVGIHQLTIRLLNTEQSITVGNLNSWP